MAKVQRTRASAACHFCRLGLELLDSQQTYDNTRTVREGDMHLNFTKNRNPCCCTKMKPLYTP
jgi:hypothetical protein